MLRCRSLALLTLLLIVAASHAASAELKDQWRHVLRVSGSSGRTSPSFQTTVPRWRITYHVLRQTNASWAYFSLNVKSLESGDVVARAAASDYEIPRRTTTKTVFDGVRGTSDEEIRSVTLSDRLTVDKPGTYYLHVYANGVTWQAEVQEPGPGGGAAAPEPDTSGRAQLWVEEDEQRATSLGAAWSTLKSFTAQNAAEQRQFILKDLDCRIEYLVEPRGPKPPPSLMMALKDTQTGQRRTIVALPASMLSSTVSSREPQGGTFYLHQPGTYELEVQAVNVNWTANIQVSGEPASVELAPADTLKTETWAGEEEGSGQGADAPREQPQGNDWDDGRAE